MEYIHKVLGIKVTYEDVEFKHLPNFIATRYRLQMVSMNEQKMIFLYPRFFRYYGEKHFLLNQQYFIKLLVLI